MRHRRNAVGLLLALLGSRGGLIALLAFLPFTASSVFAQAICAEVKIEIPQRVSLERQAFNARLGIENAIDLPISELSVTLEFRDVNGNPVPATSDPNNTTAKFFFRDDGSSNTSGGNVAGNTNAELTWLIIPTAGAGGTNAQGKVYLIGAQVSFKQGGQARSLNVAPDTITVEPQPLLKLDYFLPEDVYGDDPFTPAPEEPIPFPLGVRIRNVGAGIARAVQIETASPRIVENTNGLQIAFQINSSFVQNSPAQPTLLLNFANIAAGSAKVGRWLMTVSLSGRFTEFKADFTHSDALGGALTSLISSVTTHTLVKDVLVDLPGRDSVEDFLARDIDTYRVYESNNQEVEVIDRSAQATIQQVAGGAVQIVLGNSILPSYGQVRDPTNGQLVIDRATRFGGIILARQNVWLSKKRLGNDTDYTHFINIFDPMGASTYLVTPSNSDAAGLSGEVFRDLNDNGIKDTNERGIEGARIALRGTNIAGQPIVRDTTTNNNGLYSFATLPAGSVSLAVAAMPGLRDGITTAGTLNGTAVPGTISAITLQNASVGTGYRFAKVSTSALPQAELEVRFDSLTPGIGIGETLSVAVKARNNGPDDATASVQLSLPLGLEIVSALASTGTYDSATKRWTLPTLVPNAEFTLTLSVRANVAGTRALLASISSVITDPIMANNTASLAISASSIPGELIFKDGFEDGPNNITSDLAKQAAPLLIERIYRDERSLLQVTPPLSDGFESSNMGFEDARQ